MLKNFRKDRSCDKRKKDGGGLGGKDLYVAFIYLSLFNYFQYDWRSFLYI
jgi:hypothetical protein